MKYIVTMLIKIEAEAEDQHDATNVDIEFPHGYVEGSCLVIDVVEKPQDV